VEYCPWSNLPDDDWRWQDDYPWVIGEFVWTGYDYLGEPSPYDEYWPSRSSYFGICDLAGLPKDRYWLYRSHWNKDEHTIHLLPHWTWSGREGQVTPVYCYTDYDEAELFVNGKSQGRIRKQADVASVTAQTAYKQSNRLDRYRLRWNDVKYEPGEIKVVVYDADGKPAGEKVMRTAGKPARLQADVWTQAGASGFSGVSGTSGSFGSSGSSGKPVLRADGQDLAFVTVSLVDKNGTLIPNADDQLRFEVSGAGTFRAVCNGDATSLESFTEPTLKLFAGQLVVVVQAGTKKGQLTLKVTDPQRKLTQKVTIPVK
jgi:beta-galactosidase